MCDVQAARRTSLGRPSAILLLVSLAVVLVAADQITKQLAVTHLEPGVAQPFIGELLRLRLVFNPGAAFSLGAGSTWVFTILASVVLAFILIWLTPRVAHRGWAVGFGLLAAGVAGNLIDRLFRAPGPGRGHVVDFLELPNWPIFNIADMCIIAAAIVVVSLSLFTKTSWDTRPWEPVPEAATDTDEATGDDPNSERAQ